VSSLTHVGTLGFRARGRTRGTVVLGVPVSLQPSWLFGVALTAWTSADGLLPATVPGRSLLAYGLGGVALAAAVAASVVAHEVAHCLVARRAGIGVRALRLAFFGGAAQLDAPPTAPRVVARIALAGPAASAAAALAAALTHVALVEADVDPLLAALPALLAVGNAALALVNLLPAPPLDGGSLLGSVVWGLSGREAVGARAAAVAGRTVGFVLLVVAVVASAVGDTPAALWLALLALHVHGA
jgi:Zn-dependent protease